MLCLTGRLSVFCRAGEMRGNFNFKLNELDQSLHIRADVPTTDLLHFYTTAVRPVLEYACPVWHSGLTVAQSDMLDSVQKRAIRIVYSDADYQTSLIVAGIDILRERREVLTAKFFKRQVLASGIRIEGKRNKGKRNKGTRKKGKRKKGNI